MSGRICRETYANYGSYLRSRGYDKAICDLIDMIESGKIPVGPLWPVDKCNAILNGTLEIIECDGNIPGPGSGGVQSGMGQLWVQGGYNGSSSGPALARDLSIQAANGINTGGAIIQKAPANSTVVVPNLGQITDQNYLESNTILDGGLTMNALPSSSGAFLTPPKSVITDIINSNSSTSLPAAWSNGSIPDFPNDYTLATTKAIYDYVSSIAGATDLTYDGNIGSPGQVNLTTQNFTIKGGTVTPSSGTPYPPQNIITEANNSQELIIDLTDTGVVANSYGSSVINSGQTTQSIKVPKFKVDQKGRLTTASEHSIDVMSSFTVKTTTGTLGPQAPYTIKNGSDIDFEGDVNIKPTITGALSNNPTIEYALSSTLVKMAAMQSLPGSNLSIEALPISSTGSTVINLKTGTSTGSQGVKINHALNIGTLNGTNTPPPATASGSLAMAGNAAIGGGVTIDGAAAITGACDIGTGANNDVNIAQGGGKTKIGGDFFLPTSLLQHTPGPTDNNLKLLVYDVTSGEVSRSTQNAGAAGQISSLRYKENVEIMTEEAAADLMKIMPRTFNYKGSNDETFGLIAEELAGTELKAAVGNDKEGRPDSINYSMLVAPLLRIVQDQNERIKALEEKVEALSK